MASTAASRPRSSILHQPERRSADSILAPGCLDNGHGPWRLNLGVCCAALAAISLQGCYDGEELEDCPAWYDPLVPDFEPDFGELVELAGCTQPWSFWTGSPCTSDLPVLFARQGNLDAEADHDFVRGNLMNGYGECIHQLAGSPICDAWVYSKFGCTRDVFEDCKCVGSEATRPHPFQIESGLCQVVGDCVQSPNYPSAYSDSDQCEIRTASNMRITVESWDVESYDKLYVNGNDFGLNGFQGSTIVTNSDYRFIRWSSDTAGSAKGWKLCKAPPSPTPAPSQVLENHTESTVPCYQWFCWTKEVEHQSCWEAEWTSSWYTECDKVGSWPFQLNEASFEAMNREESGIRSRVFDYDNHEELNHALRELPKHYEYEGQCFVTKQVTSASGMPPTSCQSTGWRVVLNGVKTCTCMRHREDGTACEAWSCVHKRFPGEKFDEIREYVCLEESPSNPSEHTKLGTGSQCGAWRGKETSFRAGESVECRSYCSTNDTDCGRWVCTYYGLPRLELFQEDQFYDDFGKRWGLTFAHCLWLTFIFLIINAAWRLALEDNFDPFFCLAAFFFQSVITFGIYLALFCRTYDNSEKDFRPYARYGARWPQAPGFGLAIMSVLSTVTFLLTFVKYPGERKGHGASSLAQDLPVVLGALTVPVIVFFYKCGFLGALPFLFGWFLLLGFIVYVKLSSRESWNKVSPLFKE